MRAKPKKATQVWLHELPAQLAFQAKPKKVKKCIMPKKDAYLKWEFVQIIKNAILHKIKLRQSNCSCRTKI